MIPMDAKGITWIGNIYQKFEALCLEVEEDTIKYMENQVQTVGEGVKKFYSDVMQDLLPPFSSDADEIAFSNSYLIKYSDVEVTNTSTVNTNVFPTSHLKVNCENSEAKRKEKDSEVIVVDKDSSLTSISGRLCENGEHFDCLSEELVISKNVEKKLPQSKTTSESISTGMDACKALSLSEELNESHEVNCPDAKELSSVELTRLDPLADSYDEIEYETKPIPASVSSSHMAVFGSSQSEESIDNIITSCSANFPEEPNELSDSYDCDALNTEAVAEIDKEMILHVDKLELEETCVIVSKDDFRCVSPAISDSRTYKKNIRQVFYPRKRSARKQEYEELAMLHGNRSRCDQAYDAAENRDPTSTVTDPKKSPHSEVCEFEWELLYY